jgi:aerobic-type carbon monoxide dehydrogenase small subunit (CoxS/CutS family)
MNDHDHVLSLTVNGKAYTLTPLPGETLAELLRHRLGLTGTKIGCNEAECGACTVMVNGEPVLSCNYPAMRAQGKDILTIRTTRIRFDMSYCNVNNQQKDMQESN